MAPRELSVPRAIETLLPGLAAGEIPLCAVFTSRSENWNHQLSENQFVGRCEFAEKLYLVAFAGVYNSPQK